MEGILEEVHQKILKSIINSNEFDNELQRTFTAAVLDLFINANSGLNFFVNYYELSRMDLVMFFKQPVFEIFGEEVYNQLENKIRKD